MLIVDDTSQMGGKTSPAEIDPLSSVGFIFLSPLGVAWFAVIYEHAHLGATFLLRGSLLVMFRTRGASVRVAQTLRERCRLHAAFVMYSSDPHLKYCCVSSGKGKKTHYYCPCLVLV